MRSLPLLFGVLCLLPSEVMGQGITDPSTGVTFPANRSFLDQGRGNLTAVGTAVRFRDGFKFYTLIFYVNLAELKTKAKGAPRDPESLGRLLINGGVSHAFVTSFYAGVAGVRRLDFLKENVLKTWPAFNPEVPEVRDFIGFFQEDLKRGETTEVWIDTKGFIYGRRGSNPPRVARAPQLGKAFTATYFGDQAMDAQFKKVLLEGLAQAMK